MLLDDYKGAWTEINAQLRCLEESTGLLNGALCQLETHQRGSGFIRDDLHEIRRFNFVHPEHAFRYLRVQFNPRRALRFVGSGVRIPPEGIDSINDGCFLCRDNVEWQQQGKEIGFETDLSGIPFHIWMNPYPLLPCHVVVSTREHVSQEWALHKDGTLPLEQLICNLVELARRLPGFIGFYNGIHAGASIPGHMHYQFCRRPEEHMHFPLEQAERDFTHFEDTGIVRNYPLAVAVWQGNPKKVGTEAIHWVRYWADVNKRHLDKLAANFIVTTEPTTGEVVLFFAPRDRERKKSYHMAGLVGGLEVMGELVFSTEEERIAIEQGDISYDSLLQIYQDIYTPFFIDSPAQIDHGK